RCCRRDIDCIVTDEDVTSRWCASRCKTNVTERRSSRTAYIGEVEGDILKLHSHVRSDRSCGGCLLSPDKISSLVGGNVCQRQAGWRENKTTECRSYRKGSSGVNAERINAI